MWIEADICMLNHKEEGVIIVDQSDTIPDIIITLKKLKKYNLLLKKKY